MFNSNLFRLLIVILGLFFLFLFRLHLAAQPAVDPDHRFNTQAAFERLERILGDEAPHPVDSDANDLVQTRLIAEIEDLGFTPILRDDFHCGTWKGSARCARVQNVMFWIGEPGDNAVMIASHYDSVPAGPGASDDGAGVAASLEIASILKSQKLKRPVLVLITDGEEAGLIGATSFVEEDPLAKYVKAVVSMEARGVRGPAAMFETSVPNGRDVQVLDGDIRTAITNSLLSDLYQVMPNGTDMTQYLKLGADATNYAFALGAEFYHTPRDNLAMLDKSSLFHIGANALNSVEAYQGLPPTGAEKSYIYSDILGVGLLKLPQGLGLPLIILGGLSALFAVLRDKTHNRIKALLIPVITIIVSVGLAVGLTMLIAAIRPEMHFAAAHPWALRSTQFAAALLGAATCYGLFREPTQGRLLLFASWFWLAVLGTAATLFFKGAAIIFAPALFFIILAVLMLAMNKPGLSKICAILAAFIFMLIIVPITAAAEIMLFIEFSAPFTLFLVFGFLFIAPLCLKAETIFSSKRYWITASLVVLGSLTILTCVVPAHNVDAPQALNVRHVMGDKPGEARWSIWKNNPAPKTMLNTADFTVKDVEWASSANYEAPAPDFETAGITMTLLSDKIEQEKRTLLIDVSAPDSDRVELHFMDGEQSPISGTLLGHNIKEDPLNRVVCFGRTCRDLSIEFVFPNNSKNIKLVATGLRFGLGPESQALIDARPDWVLPVQTGDVRSVRTDLDLSK